MMKLYLAGPMTHLPQFNFPAFHEAADELRDRGHQVFNPAERDAAVGFDPSNMTGEENLSEHGFSLRDALAADLKFIAEEAEAVVVLPGSENSKGVAAEVALANALSLPVVPLGAWLQFEPENAEEARLAKYIFDGTEATGETHIPYPPLQQENGVMTGEVRTTSSTGGQKGVKPERFDLIPVGALTDLARHYGVGALKYDDNQYRKGYEWSKSYAAMQRHLTAFWAGEDLDPETGSPHMAAAAWHAFTLLTFMREHPEHDDRFKVV